MPTRRPEALERDGFAVVPGALSDPAALSQTLEVSAGRGGNRQVQSLEVDCCAWNGEAMALARRALGSAARPVRILLFDKRPEANWSVPYHQDLTIAVEARAEVEGFGPWSTKADVPHVQAPAWVLEQMVAVRLHLDPCGPENAPLRVLPGTHRSGRLRHEEIDRLVREGTEEVLTAGLGDAILMRPLLLHASSPATSPSHRRVLHIEYAAVDLPAPLRWHLAIRPSGTVES